VKLALEKLVIVTRRTRLEELVARFNTPGQAKFYLDHSGGNFAEYQAEHDAYARALSRVRQALDLGLSRQFLDRSLVSTYSFSPGDLIVTLGQDGLVANTAKYVGGQPIVAVNPDPQRFDGILLPFSLSQLRPAVEAVLRGDARFRQVTLAEARLQDGQRLLGFNDLFLGARTHISARYHLRWRKRGENQSSSGVLVSTGVGSTGWMSSVFRMAAGVAVFTGGRSGEPMRLEWEDPRLLFAVREPFVSRQSQAELIAGLLEPGEPLIMESRMPSGGVIFSDGMEADYLEFNAGATVEVRTAEQQARLAIPQAA
jgi:NAD kinase